MQDSINTQIQTGPHFRTFLDYWEELGFFNDLSHIIPQEFQQVFEIALLLFTDDELAAMDAIEKISAPEKQEQMKREEEILINRLDRHAPVADHQDLRIISHLSEIKHAIPREFALDDFMLDFKIFTKTLLVRRYYEGYSDRFQPISSSKADDAADSSRFDQKIFILLDVSRSMDSYHRLLYAKALVVEFLRRKLKKKVKIYFRGFDDKPHPLEKIENSRDIPKLIEKILSATTSGHTTNLQDAIFQAVDDILFDRDYMGKAEILVVTDGLSQIDTESVQKKLDDIKLHLLKIGHDLCRPSFSELSEILEQKDIRVDPKQLRFWDEKEYEYDPTSMSMINRAYGVVRELTESYISELNDVSDKFITVRDIKGKNIFLLTEERIQSIRDSVNELINTSEERKTLLEKQALYKKIYFFSQYLQMLIKHGTEKYTLELTKQNRLLMEKRERLLKDSVLLASIIETNQYHDDKKILRQSRKSLTKLPSESGDIDQLLKQASQLAEKRKLEFKFMLFGKGKKLSIWRLLFRWLKSLYFNWKNKRKQSTRK